MTILTETLAFRVPIGIKEKLELESWQIEETKKAILLADAWEITIPEEVLQVKNKWKV